MMQKRLRILLAEGTPSETAQTLGALFSGPAGGLELTVVSTLATLIPTINLVDPSGAAATAEFLRCGCTCDAYPLAVIRAPWK